VDIILFSPLIESWGDISKINKNKKIDMISIDGRQKVQQDMNSGEYLELHHAIVSVASAVTQAWCL
jgi:hypothetical protein